MHLSNLHRCIIQICNSCKNRKLDFWRVFDLFFDSVIFIQIYWISCMYPTVIDYDAFTYLCYLFTDSNVLGTVGKKTQSLIGNKAGMLIIAHFHETDHIISKNTQTFIHVYWKKCLSPGIFFRTLKSHISVISWPIWTVLVSLERRRNGLIG